MFSLDLSGAVLAPKILDRFNDLKLKSKEVAAVMPAAYKQRILGCNEVIKTRKFGNGYETIVSMHNCRVRGCPLCDHIELTKTKGKVFSRIISHKKESPKSGVFVVKVSSGIVGVDRVREKFDDISDRLAKTAKLKRFPKDPWVRTMSIVCKDGEFCVNGYIIILPKPIYFSGNKYIKKSEWEELLGCAAKVETYRHSSDNKPYIPRIGEILKESFLDIASFSPNLVNDILAIAHKRRFRTFKRGFILPMPEKEKAKYPSTKAILSDFSSSYSVFAPDVVTMDFEHDRYLQVEDFDFKSMVDDVQLQIV